MDRDFRIVLTTLGVTGIAVISFYFGVLAWLGSESRNARGYLDEAVPNIVRNWELNTFLQETDGHQGSEDIATLEKVFRVFRDLGSLHSYGGANGSAEVTYTPPFSFRLHGVFQAQAEFETGAATITVNIHKAGGRWFIDNLQMKSKHLFDKDAQLLLEADGVRHALALQGPPALARRSLTMRWTDMAVKEPGN